MSSPQSNNVTPFSTTPVRQYARDAVAAVKQDQRSGVLAWRIATHLLNQARRLADQPIRDLSEVPADERDHYLGLANVAIALGDAIDTTAPPTRGEIARYEQRRAVSLARARAHHEASRRGHHLAVWRPSDSGYELSRCRHCPAGVSIHLETAGVSASPLLEQQCPVTR